MHTAYGPYPSLQIDSKLKELSCLRCERFSRALSLVSAKEVSDPHCAGGGGSVLSGRDKWTYNECPDEAFLPGGWG